MKIKFTDSLLQEMENSQTLSEGTYINILKKNGTEHPNMG